MGTRFTLGNKVGLNASFGYELQKASYSFDYNILGNEWSISGSTTFNGIMLKVGVDF